MSWVIPVGFIVSTTLSIPHILRGLSCCGSCAYLASFLALYVHHSTLVQSFPLTGADSIPSYMIQIPLVVKRP